MNKGLETVGVDSSTKMNCPLATIHVLTYNRFDHIYINIDSILHQTYGNIEIVVADDGSANFPKVEIEEYVNQHKGPNISRVVILANERNVGTVRNLNNAILHSKGDVYIPLSQDDDFYSDDVVEKIMRRYVEHSFNVLVTSRCGVNLKGDFIRYWPHLKARPIIEKMSVAEMFKAYAESRYSGMASGSVMIVSADFIKSFGLFDERYRLWEDGPFFYNCLRQGYPIDTAYDIISIRYEQTEGISNNPNQMMKDDIQLYLDTDFKLGYDGFGRMHRRYMDYFYEKRNNDHWLYRLFLYVKYADVCMMKLFHSEKLRRWEVYDMKWYQKHHK